MKNVFSTGGGSLILVGLLVTQSWAGAFQSDLACSLPRTRATVRLNAKGDVKGSIKLHVPMPTAGESNCAIWCEGGPATETVTCITFEAGDTTLNINAPGLGASLSGRCVEPAVAIDGGICISSYTPAP